MRIPNLFIVGAPKSGTTALYEYLRQHPDVFMSPTKEPYYFGGDLTYCMPRITDTAYRALFEGVSNEEVVGEASITYLFSASAAREIREFNQDARIIVMLRDPVAMMHSLHSQLLFTRVEDIRELKAALAAEPDRRRGQRIAHVPTIVEFLFYRAFADYAPQVRRYFDMFGRSAVHVIIFDDFVRDPAAAYREVLRFLGVDDRFQPATFKAVNRHKVSRNDWLRLLLNRSSVKRLVRIVMPFPNLRRRVGAAIESNLLQIERPRSPMDEALKRDLQSEFKPRVEELSQLLGVDLLQKWCR